MGWGERLFEFDWDEEGASAFRMGAYSRWALIRRWALVRINTVSTRECIVAQGESDRRSLRKSSTQDHVQSPRGRRSFSKFNGEKR